MAAADEDPDLLWRIDAWDSLAGRAFLTRRLPDGVEDPQVDQSAVFVAPPFFQPEPLASRAPGLAATRGTFQAGLFVGDDEVGFATLDDAIAFIRRAYKSNGTDSFPSAPLTLGTGPAGLGGGGLALELPGFPAGPLDDAIGKVIARFAQAVDEAEVDQAARPVAWTLPNPAALQEMRGVLAAAGQALVIEMLQRFPFKGSTADFIAWAGIANSLGMQLARLGLWGDVKDAVAGMFDPKKLPAKALAEMFALGLPKDFENDRHHAEPWRIIELLFLAPNWALWDLQRADGADLYRELGHFPLPQTMAERYRAGRQFGKKDPTVLTLMARWFSHPAGIANAGPLDRALLLFGGACITVGTLQRESPAYRPWWIDQNNRLLDEFSFRLAQDTWTWIGAQLPDRAFEPALEHLLQTIPHVWAQLAQAEAADDVDPPWPEEITYDEYYVLARELGDVIADLEQHDAGIAEAVAEAAAAEAAVAEEAVHKDNDKPASFAAS